MEPGDFIRSNSMSFGRPYILKIDGYVHDGWLILRNFSERIHKDFLFYVLSSDDLNKQFRKAATGGVVNNLNSELVRHVNIFIPTLQDQINVVKEIEEVETQILETKKLIHVFEEKIRKRIAKVWGEG